MRGLEIVSNGVCSNSSQPSEIPVASASISALLMVITVPTNLLVCLAIIVDPNRELRTQFNCFTLNLAIADLIVGCVAEPTSIYAHISEAFASTRGKKLSQVFQQLFHVPYFISTMASVLSIAALACERYLAITSPLRYRKHFDVKVTLIFSALIWIIALTFGLLNFLFESYIFQSFIFINSGALLTGITVGFVYTRILTSVRKRSQQWTENKIESQRYSLTQEKLSKTFALVVGALMLCYVPACLMVYYVNVATNCNCRLFHWFKDVAFWLVLLNSAVNPYVYAVRSKQYQNAIYKIIKCKCRQARKPKSFQRISFSQRKRNKKRKYGALDASIRLVGEDTNAQLI